LRHGHLQRAAETQGDTLSGVPGHFSRLRTAFANNPLHSTATSEFYSVNILLPATC